MSTMDWLSTIDILVLNLSHLNHAPVTILPDGATPVVLRVRQLEEVVSALDLGAPALADVPPEHGVRPGSGCLAKELQLLKLPCIVILPIVVAVVPSVGHLIAGLLGPRVVVLVGKGSQDVYPSLVVGVDLKVTG